MARPATSAVRLLAGALEPVRLATTGNITLSGLQAIDGVMTKAGDRILVKDQTDARKNGVYTASAGAWFRAADARNSRAINDGVTVAVQQGTVGGGKTYRFSSVNPKIGTDPITLTYLVFDVADEVTNSVLDTLAPDRLKPLVIAMFGDSRVKGGNASVGTVGLSPAVNKTWVMDPTSYTFRNAMTLGQEPYDTANGNNNIGRAIARMLRLKTDRTVYVVHYGFPGANIWQWMDPAASHGFGSNTYWPEFKARATAAFASPALVAAGKTQFDLAVVSLGANNGGSPRTDFQKYVKAIVQQCRESSLPGFKSDLPVLWMGMQEIGGNSSLHNQTIHSLRNTIDNFAIIPMDGVSNVGDNVHEDSRGMELVGIAAARAFNSYAIATSDDYDSLFTTTWGGGAAGASATSPWDPPGGFRRQNINIRTAALNCYTRLDLSLYRVHDVVTVSNDSTGGGIHYVQPANGQNLGYPGRPGFMIPGSPTGIAGVPIYPGESCDWQKVSDTEWEVVRFTQARQHFINFVGDGGADATIAANAVITGFVSEDRIGISLNAGEFSTLIPGVYEIDLSLWCIATTTIGLVTLQKQVGGAGGWTSIAAAANGNASATWARNISLRRCVNLGAGDKLRFIASSGNVVHSRTANFTFGSIRRIQGAE